MVCSLILSFECLDIVLYHCWKSFVLAQRDRSRGSARSPRGACSGSASVWVEQPSASEHEPRSWGATLRHLAERWRRLQRSLLCRARLQTARCICEVWGLFRSQLPGSPSQSCVAFTTRMEAGFIKVSRGPSSNFQSPFSE